VEETKRMKSIDKAIHGMVSKSLGTGSGESGSATTAVAPSTHFGGYGEHRFRRSNP